MSKAIVRTLRSLDAATPALTDGERQRAEKLLERIVRASGAPASRSRPIGRLVLVPTAALAVALAMVLLPGNGGGDPAYASWTATPETVSDSDLDAVSRACQRRVARMMDDFGNAELVLAERRGDHIAMLYRTDDPDQSGSCLAAIAPGSGRVQHVAAGMGGSSGPAQLAPPTGFTEGAISQYDNASITDGAVGDQVVGVTIHAGELTVEASVRNGRYVAWWPGPAFETGPLQPSGEGGPVPNLTYDLTLSDGTVVTDAEPTRPS